MIQDLFSESVKNVDWPKKLAVNIANNILFKLRKGKGVTVVT